jgi:GWxTD domain-containing protein
VALAPPGEHDTMLPDERFRLALRRDPNNARLHLEFGRWYRRESAPWLRIQARSHFRHAVRLARQQGYRGLEAEAEMELARVAWVGYEQYGHAFEFTGVVPRFDAVQGMADWGYVARFLEQQARPRRDGGETYYRGAEDHARAALAANPGHLGATRVLAVLLGDQDRWEELVGPARAAIRAYPDSSDGHRILGLALHRVGRTAEAVEAFAAALSRMDSAQRRPYENLGAILRRADQERYDALPPQEQAELRELYWAVAQPLALDSVNQVLAEFYARVTYVDLRWTVPEERLVGWQSDRGLIYVRYGPPAVWMADRDDSQVRTLWAYPALRLRFFFQGMASYSRATFAEEFGWYAREVREAAPVRFDNVPVVTALDTVLAQTAQFKGSGGGTTLAVFAFVPLGRMLRDVDLRRGRLEVAAILKDERMRDVARRARTEDIDLEDSLAVDVRTWRFEIAPREYLLRLEARDLASSRAARGMTALRVERFGGPGLELSDVVVADRIRPRELSPRRWTDFFIDPSAGLVMRGAPISLLWETYGLTPDSGGIARYRVQLTLVVDEIRRASLAARIVGGVADAIGVTGEGDARVSLSFERQESVAGREAVVDYLDVVLGGAPEGRYLLSLTVTDLVSGDSATRVREFTVTERPANLPARPR